MSGNPYRRSGPPSQQGGQHGSGNGYYNRMANSQYRHNNHNHNSHNMNHSHAYSHPHHAHNGGYSHGRYNHGYSNQYVSRHNPYNSPHHNSRYHQHQQYGQEPSGGPAGHPSSSTHNITQSKPHRSLTNTQTHTQQTSEKPQETDKQETKIKNMQLLSSRRSNDTYGPVKGHSNLPSNSTKSSSKSLPGSTTDDLSSAAKRKPLDISNLQPMKRIKSDASLKVDKVPTVERTKALNMESQFDNDVKAEDLSSKKCAEKKTDTDVVTSVPNNRIDRSDSQKDEMNSDTLKVKVKEEITTKTKDEPKEESSETNEKVMNKNAIDNTRESDLPAEELNVVKLAEKDRTDKDVVDNKIEKAHEAKDLYAIKQETENKDTLEHNKTKKEFEVKPENVGNPDDEHQYVAENHANNHDDRKSNGNHDDDEEDDDDHDDDDDDDDDEPIHRSRRTISVEVESLRNSEDETDIEDSIPVPSRKTRRLHSLLKEHSNTDEEADDEKESSAKAKNLKISKKSRTSTSASDSSRSQSPKQRKSSRAGKDASGRTLLQRMCAKGNYDEAKRLIEAKHDVNEADFAGITPLHEAALEGFYEITELLLDNGANIDVQSGQMDKDTPLIDAVSNLHYNVAELLLKKGANPMILNSQNENAVDVLENIIADYEEDGVSDGDLDKESLKVAKQIKKLILQYSKHFKSEKISKKNKIITEQEHSPVDDHHIYANLRAAGFDLLYEKIRANDVTFVLNYVSSTNGNKIPPESLLLASKLGFPDIASLLIAFGADINYEDKNGWTPLMYAVGKGHLEMVKLLLSNQADVTLRDKRGLNVIDILEKDGHSFSNSEEYKLLSQKLDTSSSKKDVAKVNTPEPTNNMDIEKSIDEKAEQISSHSTRITESQDKTSAEDSNKKADTSFGSLSENKDVSGEMKIDESIPTSVKHDDNLSLSTKAQNLFAPKNKTAEEQEHSKKHKISSESMNEEESEEENPASLADNDNHVNKKQKIAETSGKQALHSIPTVKKKKKTDTEVTERKSVSVEPTPEEIEAKKAKELEAQKAREALEHQRHERKKLKQQEIAKRIDAFEKQREEEKKAEEREILEKKRKEEEQQSQMQREQEESRKKEIVKMELRKRELIRSYYPYGLKLAEFNATQNEEKFRKYTPIYIFKLNNEEYVADLQLNLLMGVENIYAKFPDVDKRKVTVEEKQGLWNFLWPIVGSFQNRKLDPNGLQQEYLAEGEKFNELVINWIRLRDFEAWLKEVEFQPLADYIYNKDTFCRAILSKNVGQNNLLIQGSQPKDIGLPGAAAINDDHSHCPRRFGKRARDSLKMVNKSFW